jgi:hypothetical protein
MFVFLKISIMKKLLMFFVLSLSVSMLYSQPQLSAKEKAKAEKFAKKDAAEYVKKGFKPYNSSKSVYDLFYDFYRYGVMRDENGKAVYITPKKYKANGSTEAEAVENALMKVKKSVADLMNMHFNLQVSKEILISEKKQKQITKAITETWKDFKDNLDRINYVKKYELVKGKKGKYQAHVRAVFDKKTVFNDFRNEVINYLITKKHWSKEKAEKLVPAGWYNSLP